MVSGIRENTLFNLHYKQHQLLKLAATAYTFTNPFHFPFHCSIPDFSPVVINAPLFHYCEQDLQGFGGGLKG